MQGRQEEQQLRGRVAVGEGKGGKEPQKYTLQNLCAGVAQDTHTRSQRDKSRARRYRDIKKIKCPEPNHLYKVRGSRFGLGV